MPKCLHGLWDGPKQFSIHEWLRAANVSSQEFDTAWDIKISSLKTNSDKSQFVQLLQEAGIGTGNRGDRKTRLRLKVRFVNEIIGRSTGAPVPETESDNTNTQVRLSVHVWVGVSECGCIVRYMIHSILMLPHVR